MKNRDLQTNLFIASLIFLVGLPGFAEDVLSAYKKEMTQTRSGFSGFSADEGKKLYYLERTNSKGRRVSCTLCHTHDPKSSGKTRAGKVIEPLAPSVNPSRFTDSKQVEKWFLRNCRDVLDRVCTLEEKGNFITYLKSL